MLQLINKIKNKIKNKKKKHTPVTSRQLFAGIAKFPGTFHVNDRELITPLSGTPNENIF